MGAWGDGILDNDGALDALGDVFDGLETTGPEALATLVGLETWLHAPLSDRVAERLAGDAASLATLPEGVRILLAEAAADPFRFSEKGARAADVEAVLGRYCGGPRHDALLRLPGGRVVIDSLVRDAREGLDDGLGPNVNLYKASAVLGLLAPLLELAVAGMWRPDRDQVAAWRSAVARIDRATEDERDFWDGYARKVKQALKMMARA